jgi:hypothetical protein
METKIRKAVIPVWLVLTRDGRPTIQRDGGVPADGCGCADAAVLNVGDGLGGYELIEFFSRPWQARRSARWGLL